MDPGCFEDLAGRLYDLLIGPDDRIGSEQARTLRTPAGTAAAVRPRAITEQERDDMLSLAARMKLQDDLVPRALAACLETGGHECRSV